MNYRIEEKAAFRVVGAKLSTTMENDECFVKIPEFWNEMAVSGKVMKIGELLDAEPAGLLGISTGDASADSNKFNYYIAVASTKEPIEGAEELIIPAVTWAIFECVGAMPFVIQDMQKRIMTEWFPASEYSYIDAPDIELYIDADQTREDSRSEIWVPVKKK